MASVGVQAVAAKSGDFNYGVLRKGRRFRCGGRPGAITYRHQDYPKLRAHGIGFRNELHYLLRGCVSGNIVVGWVAAEQKIAHASPYQVRLMPGLAQGANDLESAVLERHSYL